MAILLSLVDTLTILAEVFALFLDMADFSLRWREIGGRRVQIQDTLPVNQKFLLF